MESERDERVAEEVGRISCKEVMLSAACKDKHEYGGQSLVFQRRMNPSAHCATALLSSHPLKLTRIRENETKTTPYSGSAYYESSNAREGAKDAAVGTETGGEGR